MSLAADVVEAEAGATAPVSLTVVNRGTATDRFEIEVEGIDSEWRFIPVPTFAVEPGESRSEKLFLKPPRLPESLAGSYPFVVRVRSLESGEFRTAQALLKLGSFHHLTMEISPKKGVVSPTTKRNDFRLTLVNLGNSEHTLQLSAQDPDDRCAYEFENDQIVLGPGQQRELEMVADPKQTPLLSSGRLIGFSVMARSLNERNVSTTAQAQLEQRSLLSPATLVAAVLLASAVGAWWTMRPVPPSVDLSVNPRHALPGENVQLSYVAQHADRIVVKMDETVIYDGPPVANAPLTAVIKGEGQATFVATATREGKSEATDIEHVAIDVPPVIPLASIDDISVNDQTPKLGASFILSWKVKDATKLLIQPLGKELPPESSSLEIAPTVAGKQTYTLFAYNSAGKSVSKSVTVSVRDESEALILVFGAEPPTVKEEDGGRTTVSWQVANAAYVELAIGGNKPQQVDPTGSLEVNLSAKTTFTLTATDDKGRKASKKTTVNYEKKVIVIEPSTPPSVDPNFPNSIPPPGTTPP